MAADSSKKALDVVPMMPRITDHKLTASNYLDWLNTIELYLLSVSIDPHKTDDPSDSGVIGMVFHCRTVKALLAYLEFLYSGKENISCMYTVCQTFYRPDMGDQSLIDYFMEFTKTYEKLNTLLLIVKTLRFSKPSTEPPAPSLNTQSAFLGFHPQYDSGPLLPKVLVVFRLIALTGLPMLNVVTVMRLVISRTLIPKRPPSANVVSGSSVTLSATRSAHCRLWLGILLLLPLLLRICRRRRLLIFGCTYSVRYVRPHFTELDPKSLKYIFLGYSRVHKGYRCYSPNLNKYVVSADVVFSKGIPFHFLILLLVKGSLMMISLYICIPDPTPSALTHSVRPLIIHNYSRRQHPEVILILDVPPTTSDAPISSLSYPSLSDDRPITFRKGRSEVYI
ncbi:hypothetical protein C2S53_010673 [Perilla frutescens var. hirtella]|uniref:Retroviral polymerase SH3-like domain-containing protein n=1 Tax=Perilla frutescens var. hirtella TaxID=608512 RepID=A0AAD4IVE8_PERFH|nr:hypothetical protein C2S53_010673 [Perilla frutescens var. hirtella]